MRIEQLLSQKVLVINRQWQGCGETTVQEALCDIVRGAATAIDTENMVPVKWEDWIKLSIREGDNAIRTTKHTVRVPTVVCKAKYASMPKKRPKWSKRGVAARDGYICQITGKYAPDGNVDHIISRSQGGTNSWSNTVWSDRKVNSKKADKTLDELGWKLIRQPTEPPAVPAVRLIEARHPDWKPFLLTD